MKQPKKFTASGTNKQVPTPLSKEAREDYMISLAMKQAEDQLLNGTASPSVIVHFLKLASEKEQLELQLLKAKSDAIASEARSEEIYQKAIDAMKSYSGSLRLNDDEEEDYENI
ncbi:MAG: hypothetical protein J6Y02_13490 [Pseudobutyrivibrio sp.]|nr:hypothetical protein [Pseudobutyrivibrio sp.]